MGAAPGPQVLATPSPGALQLCPYPPFIPTPTSYLMVEDLAQMSLIGLITLPSVAHAPTTVAHSSQDIRLKAGALKDHLVNNGLGTPAPWLPAALHNQLEQWLYFQPGVLSPTWVLRSSCCSSGPALEHPPLTSLICPASRAFSTSKNFIFRPQGPGWAAEQEAGYPAFRHPCTGLLTPAYKSGDLKSKIHHIFQRIWHHSEKVESGAVHH